MPKITPNAPRGAITEEQTKFPRLAASPATKREAFCRLESRNEETAECAKFESACDQLVERATRSTACDVFRAAVCHLLMRPRDVNCVSFIPRVHDCRADSGSFPAARRHALTTLRTYGRTGEDRTCDYFCRCARSLPLFQALMRLESHVNSPARTYGRRAANTLCKLPAITGRSLITRGTAKRRLRGRCTSRVSRVYCLFRQSRFAAKDAAGRLHVGLPAIWRSGDLRAVSSVPAIDAEYSSGLGAELSPHFHSRRRAKDSHESRNTFQRDRP
jgi:hypothetical protein